MSGHSSKLAIVLTTTSTKQQANELAAVVIAERLAACVQVSGPILSHYRWDKKIHCDEEYRVMIKTSVEAWEKLEPRLLELHPYEVPQIVLVAVEEASASYRQWLLDEIDGDSPSS